ncbi:MAG TPA: hypothetical protein VGJ84_10065 [Polyangiaceae bacterium]
MKTRAVAIANDPLAERAAQEFLQGAGSAVGAVLCGFFAAAGAYAGVLLGPLNVMTIGIGAGRRAFDGRLRQPGLGTKRPRGFRSGDPVPDAARVAVPTSVSAVLVAYNYHGGDKLAALLRPSIAQAERCGAPGRAALLRRIRAVGAVALAEPSFVRPLLRVAGLSEGGLLTPADFGKAPDMDQPAVQRRVSGAALCEPPWAAECDAAHDWKALGIGYAVLAVDSHGVFAMANYYRIKDGLLIEDLELEMPPVAVPVQRGVTRLAPGSRLPTPAPIAARISATGVPLEALAAPAVNRLNNKLVEHPPLRVRRDPSTLDVDAARA